MDRYSFAVNSDNPANSGKANAMIASPKLSGIFSPIEDTELYLIGDAVSIAMMHAASFSPSIQNPD